MAITVSPDGTISLSLTFPWSDIKSAYQKALLSKAQTTEIKGFRKGKAPLDSVEKVIGKSRLYQDAFASIFFTTYDQLIIDNHLKPLITPEIKPLKTNQGEDWQIEATTAQAPTIDLTDYKAAVTGALAKEKLWTPAKGTPQTDTSSEDKKLSLVFDALLKTAKISVSLVLINQEKSRALARLLDQVNKLGLTIDQYLAGINKTSQTLQQEYALTAETNLKLEFILQEISRDLKIQPQDSQIDRIIAKAPQEEQVKLNQPEERAYLAAILRKKQTIDALLRM